VLSPIDLGDLAEDVAEVGVQCDLSVEVDDEVVDLTSVVEIRQRMGTALDDSR
jgi:hypothetical protein